MCKNGESRPFDGVYFIPRLMTNIMSVGQLDEIGYKIDIDTGMIKILEPGGVLLKKVKRESNRLYLLHLKFAQPTCLAVRGRSNEVRGVGMSASGTSTWRLSESWLGRSWCTAYQR
jgi:hypothetical protein